MRTAIFVGSFDPFTIGHDNIVRRALCLFDHLVIGVAGDNVNKPYIQPTEQRIQAIKVLYDDVPAIEVKAYYGLAVDLAKAEDAHFIVKGVRNVKDFEHEQEQADVNSRIGGIETILLFAEPELSCISSSMVKELKHFGADVSKFLPKKK